MFAILEKKQGVWVRLKVTKDTKQRGLDDKDTYYLTLQRVQRQGCSRIGVDGQ